jgi:hypothetical protein
MFVVYSGVRRLNYHVIRRVTALLCRIPFIFDHTELERGHDNDISFGRRLYRSVSAVLVWMLGSRVLVLHWGLHLNVTIDSEQTGCEITAQSLS